jgi:hypothetical protein
MAMAARTLKTAMDRRGALRRSLHATTGLAFLSATRLLGEAIRWTISSPSSA